MTNNRPATFTADIVETTSTENVKTGLSKCVLGAPINHKTKHDLVKDAETNNLTTGQDNNANGIDANKNVRDTELSSTTIDTEVSSTIKPVIQREASGKKDKQYVSAPESKASGKSAAKFVTALELGLRFQQMHNAATLFYNELEDLGVHGEEQVF